MSGLKGGVQVTDVNTLAVAGWYPRSLGCKVIVMTIDELENRQAIS